MGSIGEEKYIRNNNKIFAKAGRALFAIYKKPISCF